MKQDQRVTFPHPDTLRLNWLEHMARNGGLNPSAALLKKLGLRRVVGYLYEVKP